MSNRFKPDQSILIVVILAFTCLIGVVLSGTGGPVNNEELYKLLGVSKKSTTREIRIAFKKLALEKHPDKNKVRAKKHQQNSKIMRFMHSALL